jgi:hypothetical protein
VARVLAQRYGGEGDARGGPGRQVLQRVHGDVDAVVEQRLAQRADEHARAAELGQRLGVAVSLGGDLDQHDLAAKSRAQPVTHPAGLSGGEDRGAGAQADRLAHVSSPG